MYTSSTKYVCRTILEVIRCEFYWLREYLKWICGSRSGSVLCERKYQVKVCLYIQHYLHGLKVEYVNECSFVRENINRCEKLAIAIIVCIEIIVHVAQQCFKIRKKNVPDFKESKITSCLKCFLWLLFLFVS